jgi:hypothetical protein
MSTSNDRPFTVTENLQALSEDERQLAALQRRVAARRKLAEAYEELELLERESSSAGAKEAVPEAPPRDEQPSETEPRQPGKRARAILQGDPSRGWNPRQMWEQFVERGWAEPTKDALLAVRVALKRLEQRDPQVVRTQDGITFSYRWVEADTSQLPHGSNGHAPTLDWRSRE